MDVLDTSGEKIREYFLGFLENFAESLEDGGRPYYNEKTTEMINQGKNTLWIDFSHIFRFNHLLATAISEHYYRFEPFLTEALRQFVDKHAQDQPSRKEYWIGMYGLSIVHKLRELTTSKIGQLLAISGTVTRTSEVRPELYLGMFQCNECRAQIKNVEQQFKYTEPVICPNPVCGNRTKWTLLIETSIFVDWQRVRIQENSGEIPPGSMPRTLDVIVRNDVVEQAKAGDKCDFSGCLIVVPDISQLALPGGKLEGRPDNRGKEGFGAGITGLKALGVRELSYRLAFMGSSVVSTESRDRPGDLNWDCDDPVCSDEVIRMRGTPNLYQKMVESICPTIFGHQDVKAGLLLMLLGGVHKTTAEGIGLRGDVNICIVGDPGTAKSQFLKYVTNIFPRSVYTSGKSSSAAGLTASVVKDEETGEFTIEAGALMLADNGICAIDEFDKMDLTDQVAIHEAMEQQTISIAKAGIQATLNARASILAAANPLYGRYDRKKPLRQNISMSAPIMSRFDLFFVVLDDCNEASDYNIARHILSVHRLKDEAVSPEFSTEELQTYIKYAKALRPVMTPESAQLLVDKYCLLRQNDATSAATSYRITVRQLESMIRLSEALAKLHLDKWVRPSYVREAYRLLKASTLRVESENIDLDAIEDHEIQNSFNRENTVSERPLSIQYETYVRISNMLVYGLRRNSAEGGMTKDALVEWYLEQIEEEMECEQVYHQKKRLAEAIIDRLVCKDCVLIELKDSLQPHPLLVVHPNYNS